MVTAEFRFYEELNDFLPPDRRGQTFTHALDGRASVKDVVESLGVPHTEIDLILVDGESVDFSRVVAGGERISVYPVFEAFDVGPVTRLRPEPLRVPRFVLDVHLGKLARYVRLLGFDARYDNECDDETLVHIARDERRIILTRDLGVLKRAAVTHGYFVRATDPRAQMREIVGRFDLARIAAPFTRCVRCNVGLVTIARADLDRPLPADVLRRFDRFRLCPACDRVFWQGSHYARMAQYVREMLDAAAGDGRREAESD